MLVPCNMSVNPCDVTCHLFIYQTNNVNILEKKLKQRCALCVAMSLWDMLKHFIADFSTVDEGHGSC
jgi:hypothetical protein